MQSLRKKVAGIKDERPYESSVGAVKLITESIDLERHPVNSHIVIVVSVAALTQLTAASYSTSLFARFIYLGVVSGMANHKSAIKRARQTERRNEVNRKNRSRLRTEIKQLRAAVDSGDREQAQTLLPKTISVIDKSIQKGVIHKNAAARYKARLTGSVSKMAS
jgi:small subunit ribosomal protein S20